MEEKRRKQHDNLIENENMKLEEADMVKIDKKFWSYDIKEQNRLLDILNTLNKDELTHIRKHLDLTGVSSLNKKDLIQVLVKELPVFAAKWLKRLDEEQFALMARLIKAKSLPYEVFEEQEINVFYLRELGLAFTGKKDYIKVVFLPDELQGVLESVELAELRPSLERNTEWVRLVSGMVYYYGVMDVEDILAKFTTLTKSEKIDWFEFADVIGTAAGLYGDFMLLDNKIKHVLVLNEADIIHEQYAIHGELSYYEATYDEIYAAGKHRYIEENEAFKVLVSFIEKEWSIRKAEANDMVADLVVILLNGGTVKDLFKYLEEDFKIASLSIAEQLAQLFIELNNNTHMWCLKGHAPNALTKKGKEQRGNVVYANFKASNIGRNDPCPCGSGKKYKKCCGAK